MWINVDLFLLVALLFRPLACHHSSFYFPTTMDFVRFHVIFSCCLMCALFYTIYSFLFKLRTFSSMVIISEKHSVGAFPVRKFFSIFLYKEFCSIWTDFFKEDKNFCRQWYTTHIISITPYTAKFPILKFLSECLGWTIKNCDQMLNTKTQLTNSCRGRKAGFDQHYNTHS